MAEQREPPHSEDTPEVAVELVAAARARSPEAAIIVLPRSDGRYPVISSDVVGLLRDQGVRTDFATDPKTAGNYEYRSADVVLPVLLLLGDIGTIVSAIDGIIFLVRYFAERQGGARVSLTAGRATGPAGDDIRWVNLTATGDPHTVEATARQALRGLFDD